MSVGEILGPLYSFISAQENLLLSRHKKTRCSIKLENTFEIVKQNYGIK